MAKPLRPKLSMQPTRRDATAPSLAVFHAACNRPPYSVLSSLKNNVKDNIITRKKKHPNEYIRKTLQPPGCCRRSPACELYVNHGGVANPAATPHIEYLWSYPQHCPVIYSDKRHFHSKFFIIRPKISMARRGSLLLACHPCLSLPPRIPT